jgi:predicted XRE-type DNA-binding protein
MKTENNIEFERSSGNVYKDLGYKKPNEMLIKAGLAAKISQAIRTLRLTQDEAAEITGVSQDKISNLLRGNFSRISEKKLMNCLINLGYDIEISVKQATTSIGHLLMAG